VGNVHHVTNNSGTYDNSADHRAQTCHDFNRHHHFDVYEHNHQHNVNDNDNDNPNNNACPETDDDSPASNDNHHTKDVRPRPHQDVIDDVQEGVIGQLRMACLRTIGGKSRLSVVRRRLDPDPRHFGSESCKPTDPEQRYIAHHQGDTR
jgi:hypothetical protein